MKETVCKETTGLTERQSKRKTHTERYVDRVESEITANQADRGGVD